MRRENDAQEDKIQAPLGFYALVLFCYLFSPRCSSGMLQSYSTVACPSFFPKHTTDRVQLISLSHTHSFVNILQLTTRLISYVIGVLYSSLTTVCSASRPSSNGGRNSRESSPPELVIFFLSLWLSLALSLEMVFSPVDCRERRAEGVRVAEAMFLL